MAKGPLGQASRSYCCLLQILHAGGKRVSGSVASHRTNVDGCTMEHCSVFAEYLDSDTSFFPKHGKNKKCMVQICLCLLFSQSKEEQETDSSFNSSRSGEI